MKKFDLIVIGAGSGGVRAARLAAEQGVKTLIIEGRHWGGTCVNLGCVPKKFLVYASDYSRALASKEDYAFSFSRIPHQPEWRTLLSKITKETERLGEIYQRRLRQAGAHLQPGMAYFISSKQIGIRHSRQVFAAEKIIITTGSKPLRPDIPGADLGLVSDDVFSPRRLPKLPRSIAVVGGGYIAVEFASIFAAFGVNVKLIHRSDTFLRGFDREVVKFVLAEMEKNPNIKILYGAEVRRINRTSGGKIKLSLTTGNKSGYITTDEVLLAIGRTPNTEDLELPNLDILGERGEIRVDKFYQTGQEGIYALGDVIGRLGLTPVAIAEAKKLIAKHFSRKSKTEVKPLDYNLVPMAVFSRPEMAKVGLSESQAKGLAEDIKIYSGRFTPLSQAFAKNKKRFFIKLITESKSGRLLGVHLAGEGAAEMIQGFALAIKAKLSKDMLDDMVVVHPTNAEEVFTLS